MSKIRHYGDIRNYNSRGRAVYLVFLGIFLISTAIPTLQTIAEYRRFKLSDATKQLLDAPSKQLAHKFSYDPQRATYHFNEKEKAVEASSSDDPMKMLQAQITAKDGAAKTLYSVDMPEKIQDGFTYYDNNLKVSFKLIPEGQIGKGILHDDRLVYKLADGTAAVFTAKSNGIKEDIILEKAPATDDPVWRYNLDLPKTLEARMLDDGELGIYSADPSLFGNISYGSDSDRVKIASAREGGVKNNLVFAVPAPVIKESGGAKSGASAKFLLSSDGKTLTVATTGLLKAHYPISVDPTVVITSTSDFTYGNDETSIEFSAGQINRAGLTGGALGSFSTSGVAQLPETRIAFGSVMYNGYIYLISDESNSVKRDYITYGKVNDDGTIDSWTTDSTTWTAINRRFGAFVAYNGYIFTIGGVLYGGQTEVAGVWSAPLNPNDGSVGAFTYINNLPNALYHNDAFAHNGYIYSLGGYTNATGGVGATSYWTVNYARINANGTLGSWAATTHMLSERFRADVVVSNGYVYALAGRRIDGFGVTQNNNNYEYARINADGTLGAWTQSGMAGTYDGSSLASNGYIYIVTGAGYNGNVYSVELNGAGVPNTPLLTTNLNSGVSVGYNGASVYKGYMYVFGGTWDGSNGSTLVKRAPINPAGTPRSFSTSTNVGSTGRTGAASVAYNGYLYVMGGYNGTTYLTDTQRATIDSISSSTIGTWASAGSAFTTGRAFAAATVHGGRIYLSGGINSGGAAIDDLQHIPINLTNGNITGSWTADTAPSSARYKHGMVAYSGNLYLVGGDTGSGVLNTIRSASLNGSGGIVSWSNNTAFTTARRGMGVTVHGNSIYIAGGYDGTNMLSDVQRATVDASGTLSSWSSTGSSLGTARSGIGLQAHNGYLYAYGGVTGTGESTASGIVEYAVINNDGSTGTWTASDSLGTARGYAAFAAQNGYITAVTGGSTGGTGGTLYNTSELSYVDNGGNGIVGAWGTPSTSSFTTARSQHASAAYNGYLYVIGGLSTATAQTDIRIGTITTTGTITTYAAGTVLPLARYGHDAIIHNGYIYVIGGRDSSGAVTDTVYKSALDKSTGAITGWTTVTPLTTPLSGVKATTYGGKLYITGGTTNASTGATTTEVRYASFNNDGTIGSWTGTTAFTGSRARHSTFAVNGYLYIAGGVSDTTNNTTALNDVQYATINSGGTIGSWSYASDLPTAIAGSSIMPYNGYLYMLGGRDGAGSVTTATYRTTVNSNGTIGSWNTAGPVLSSARTDQGAAITQGTVYLTGGNNGSADVLTVSASRISSIPRISIYSKLVDTGVAVDLQSLIFNGFMMLGPTGMKYQMAPANGIFGTEYSSHEVTPVGVNCLTPPTTQYFFVRTILDDTVNASFPDLNQTYKSNIQDITFTFAVGLRGPTDKRLFQGKFFTQGELQPYDTCGA